MAAFSAESVANSSGNGISLTLTKEQAALLLPLLPSFQQPTLVSEPGKFSVQEMFTKKKKNTKGTGAQNYIHVSYLLTLHNLKCNY